MKNEQKKNAEVQKAAAAVTATAAAAPVKDVKTDSKLAKAKEAAKVAAVKAKT